MNKLLTNLTGKMPFFLDDLGFIDTAVRDAFYGIMSAFGVDITDSFKLSGCVVSVNGSTYQCSAGYISYQGEIFQVDAHSHTNVSGTVGFVPVITYDPFGNKLFLDSVSKDTWQIRKAKLDDISQGVDAMPYNADYIDDKIVSKLRAYSTTYSTISNTRVQYRKDFLNVVTLQGMMIPTDTPTLPTGYRPSSNVTIEVPDGLGATCELRIRTTGLIEILNADGDEMVNLCGISFYTNQ